LPIWSKHPQRSAIRTRRRKQIHRHTHESKRQRSRPERPPAGILLFGFHSFTCCFRQRVSPSSTTQCSWQEHCRVPLSVV
jgi:hypothetical protein